MTAILLGLLLFAFCAAAVLPQALNWGEYIIASLKGVGPVAAALTGIVAVFIGIADINDKKEARKEEKEAAKAAEEAQKTE